VLSEFAQRLVIHSKANMVNTMVESALSSGSSHKLVNAPLNPNTSAQLNATMDTELQMHKRVLIIDDNVDVADTLAQWLQLAGHDVRTVYSGVEAISATAEFRPEIILLDIGLPDLNGYDVAAKLRALTDLPPFLLVAVTGYGQASDEKAFIEAGFDRHFAKPMGLSKLESIGLHL